MADLTAAEQTMFAKYWGKTKLEIKDKFWEDAWTYYGDGGRTNIAMPLEHNFANIRWITDMLECPPGKCGVCCHYSVIEISDFDIKKIIDNTKYTKEDFDKLIKIRENGTKYRSGDDNGCPFLKDNVCTIYKHRPDTCCLFPIQTPRQAFSNGKPMMQMLIRVKCLESMRIIRKILTDNVADSERILLPDLSTIPTKQPQMQKQGVQNA